MNRREACLLLMAAPAVAVQFHSRWPNSVQRPWIGPEFWSNPLQDWQLRDGRIECIVAGGDRNVCLLTHEFGAQPGSFQMRVKLGRLEEDARPLGEGFAGFRLGIRGHFHDYRDSAVYGIGMNAGLASDGRLFIGKLADDAPRVPGPLRNLELVLEAKPAGSGYELRLTARDGAGRPLGTVERAGVRPEWLTGGVALVCSSGRVEETPDDSLAVMTMGGINKRGTNRGGTLRFWFRDWTLAGDKVTVHQERAWGPILFAMHTLSRNTLKLTAQMAPIGAYAALATRPAGSSEPVRLQIRSGASGSWRTVASSAIDPLSWTASFRVTGWNDTQDTAYRVWYRAERDHYFEGTIRKNPVGKPKIVVGALSCINDLGFPHSDMVRNLGHFRADFLAFTGDQIYERVAGYGIERAPIERAVLDYLRKWFLFGWAFRDLIRDTPCVCMPDDHDVYHGNVWGAGGRHAEGTGQAGQDSGGYVQPAEWVNMVQRTQTSHLPDPFDPAPVQQGIGVYYCPLLYGGVSFAILEDRKWKSAPKRALPKAQVVNGWAQNPEYHVPTDGDAPGAQLLGERQIRFLNEWAADWSGGAWMKVVVSQTIFANVATLPKPANTDEVVPKLPILPAGGYAQDDLLVADHDSNGWPQSARNEALRAIRRALALHIAGDQHLGSTVQYGIDDWNDAAWALCVPAVANIFPRRWYPPQPGRNPTPGGPRNTGEFLDGFGNKVTVHAVFNPQAVDAEPWQLCHRAPGYGILEFDRDTRKITIANWPRWVDPRRPGARPAEGWPIAIEQTANGLPRSGWVLNPVSAKGKRDVILQVSDQSSGEVLYTLPPRGETFTPAVFKDGLYTVKIMDRTGKPISVLKDQKARKG